MILRARISRMGEVTRTRVDIPLEDVNATVFFGIRLDSHVIFEDQGKFHVHEWDGTRFALKEVYNDLDVAIMATCMVKP